MEYLVQPAQLATDFPALLLHVLRDGFGHKGVHVLLDLLKIVRLCRNGLMVDLVEDSVHLLHKGAAELLDVALVGVLEVQDALHRLLRLRAQLALEVRAARPDLVDTCLEGAVARPRARIKLVDVRVQLIILRFALLSTRVAEKPRRQRKGMSLKVSRCY